MIKALVCFDNIDIITILLERQAMENDQLEFVYKGVHIFANGIQIEENGVVLTTEYDEIVAEIECGTDDSPFKDRVFFTFEHGLIFIEKEKGLFDVGRLFER